MKISDLLALSYENLRRRKGRTALTVAGVVIGTFLIVIMVSLGIAVNVGFDEMLQSMGDLRKITVYGWGVNGSEVQLNDDAVAQMSKLDHVLVATPYYQPRYLSFNLVAGKNDRYQTGYVELYGIYPEALEMMQYELKSGSYLPEKGTVPSGNKPKVQVVVGEQLGYNFTDTKKKGENAYRWQGMTDAAGNELPPFVDILSDTMTLKSQGSEDDKQLVYQMDVLGVLLQDNEKGYETYGGVFMDLNVLKKLESDYMRMNNIKAETTNTYDQVVVMVDDIDNVEAVEEYINDELGFQTGGMSSWREQMQGQSQMLQLILGGLGAVSLFVAALSIVNTMSMSILERTREIGVMKVLGCGIGKIRTLFLLEASMIGLTGGLLGIGISYLVSFALNHFAPFLMMSGLGNILPMYGSKISVIPVWLSVGSVFFATLIGFVAGILPPGRAVKISALEAIRHE